MKVSSHDWKAYSIIYLVCLLIELYFFGSYLYNPNASVFAFGGDGLVIYFDMIYHVLHDPDFIHLSATNYPYGESILLTDAQAALSTSLKIIHTYLFPVATYIPGIVHASILYLLPFTAIFLFKTFRILKMEVLFAAVFSILICFMSPQIMRIGGHFGLAYPFLIPMSIYWLIKKYKNLEFLWTDLLYGFILFFFFINNPYIGFAASALIFIAAVVLLLNEKSKKKLVLILCGLAPIILAYICIHISDPFDDRIERQWGFFYYFASIGGMFFPTGSFLYDIITSFYQVGDARFEGRINVGFITSLTILGFIIYWIKNKISKKASGLKPIPLPFQYIFIASFLLFLYAANYSLYGFAKPFMEKYMGPLLMFKASGRLAWPFYYGLTMMATFIIYNTLQKINNKKYKFAILLIIIITWTAEDFRFMQSRFNNIHFANPFNLEENKDLAIKSDINKDKYQAIYLLPIIQTWNDKLDFQLDFKTQYAGTMLSIATGIPWINGTLSRAPMLSSITSIQLASHPALLRERIKDLNPDKKVLIVYGNQKQKLTIGEKYLLDKSTYIGEYVKSSLYEIAPSDMEGWSSFPESGEIFYHNSFKDKNSVKQLSKDGALSIAKGNHEIWKGDLKELFPETEKVEISIWLFNDYKTFEIPKLRVKTGSSEKSFFRKDSKDYFGYWVKQKIEIPVTPGETIITSEANAGMTYDDLEIRDINNNSLYLHVSGMTYWNNFPR